MPAYLREMETQRNAAFYAKDSTADPDEQMRLNKELFAEEQRHQRSARARQLRFELPDPGDGGMRAGNDVQERKFSQRLRPERRAGADEHRAGRHRPARLRKHSLHSAQEFHDPLQMGLYLIWSGNAAVLVDRLSCCCGGCRDNEKSDERTGCLNNQLFLRFPWRFSFSSSRVTMKILDRYVLVSFLKNYVIALMVLLGLYIVLDMVFNFDQLVDVKGMSTEQGFAGAVQIIKGSSIIISTSRSSFTRISRV
jgi:hypothetical protein